MWSLTTKLCLRNHVVKRYNQKSLSPSHLLCSINRPVTSRHSSARFASSGRDESHSYHLTSLQASIWSPSFKLVCRPKTNQTACPKMSYYSSPHLQAGHNKWSKIKRKKAVADMDRSRYTHRYVQKIIAAVRIGGSSSVDKNLQLASVIEQAKVAGVPKANVDSAIQRASSKMSSSSSERVMFDARGPNSYLMLIEAVTDNIKRTRPQIKLLLEKNG